MNASVATPVPADDEESTRPNGPSAPARDSVDQELLNLVQEEFPLASRPYAVLGERSGLAEGEVMERMRRLKAEGVIRQTSAIFDTRALGYKSSLIAMKTERARSDEAAAVLS